MSIEAIARENLSERRPYHYLSLLDLMAGRPARYTVYAIRRSGDLAAKIIGRELPRSECRRVIAAHRKKHLR